MLNCLENFFLHTSFGLVECFDIPLLLICLQAPTTLRAAATPLHSVMHAQPARPLLWLVPAAATTVMCALLVMEVSTVLTHAVVQVVQPTALLAAHRALLARPAPSW